MFLAYHKFNKSIKNELNSINTYSDSIDYKEMVILIFSSTNTPCFPFEEYTDQGLNPSGSKKKKKPSLATQKIVAGHRLVATVVGLVPPTRG